MGLEVRSVDGDSSGLVRGSPEACGKSSYPNLRIDS
jgi:hypothetical protein